MNSKSRIMYVDDEADIRSIVEMSLEDEEDFEVRICASGQEAQRVASDFKPDLVLLDVMMPGMDGPTTFKHLREMQGLQQLPVVFVTAKVQPQEVSHLKSLGAVAVIAKPFDPMQLPDTLRNILSKSQQTPAKPKDKRDRLAELREEFRQELPGRLAKFTDCWRKASGIIRWSTDHAELLALAHALAGSAAIFGFARVGDVARTLEDELFALSQRDEDIAPALQEKLSALLKKLLAEAQKGPDQELLQSSLGAENSQIAAAPQISRHIILIEDDHLLAQAIQMQLSTFDWKVCIFSSTNAADAIVQDPPPAAIIVDLSLPEGPLAGINFMSRVQGATARKIPHIVISSRTDWEARLAAVRSGADAYLTKPLDFAVLAEQLDRITLRVSPKPYRILMLDDDETLLKRYALILGSAGMMVETLTDPTKLLECMVQHQPEIVLMDLHMPTCSGVEAMQVIRQDPQYNSVPVVFLSTEVGFSRQLNVMQSGAEDFLRKDLTEQRLINAIKVRAERFRQLTALIREDSLTNLLNHVAFKLRLENEVERSRRSAETLSLAMVDIDFFKKVNDTYGHPMGDKVIKSLAQLFKTRLRSIDIIGRYGGEEFIIAMPNTPLTQAKKILDELRDSFSNLLFSSGNSSFHVTFSAGIACYPQSANAASLIADADATLYCAKTGGRNRVEVYTPS